MSGKKKKYVTCYSLEIEMPYVGICFGHAMSKACQYATIDDKVYSSMLEVSIAKAQGFLQNTVTWTKKSDKGRQEWDCACVDLGIP